MWVFMNPSTLNGLDLTTFLTGDISSIIYIKLMMNRPHSKLVIKFSILEDATAAATTTTATGQTAVSTG